VGDEKFGVAPVAIAHRRDVSQYRDGRHFTPVAGTPRARAACSGGGADADLGDVRATLAVGLA
jgi:hypothetical protein